MIIKYFKRSFLMAMVLGIPYPTFATLVSCGIDAVNDPCTFLDFFDLLNTVMEFLVVTVATPLVVLLIVYGGVTIVLNASNPGKRGKGKDIIQVALIGFALVLASFVLVKFIVIALTGNAGLLQGVFGS